jgi:hypothetical protein
VKEVALGQIFFGFSLYNRHSTIVPYHSSLNTEVCDGSDQTPHYDAICLEVAAFISDPALLCCMNKSRS